MKIEYLLYLSLIIFCLGIVIFNGINYINLWKSFDRECCYGLDECFLPNHYEQYFKKDTSCSSEDIYNNNRLFKEIRK